MLRSLRWLVVPLAVGLLVLTGLGASIQDRRSVLADETDDRSEPIGGRAGDQDRSEQQNPRPLDDARSDPGSGGSDVELASETGSVGVELGGDVAVAHPRTGEGAGEGTAASDSSGAGGVALTSGMRLTDDGGLEPIDQADVQAGDIVLASAEGGGIDVLRAGGGQVEVRPTDGGIDVAEVNANGERTPVAPNEDGVIDLGDGVTLRVPIGTGQATEDASSAAAGPAGGDTQSFGDRVLDGPARRLLIAIAAVGLMAAAIGYLLYRRRQEEPFGPDFVGPDGIPAARFDEFAAMLAADHDLARAIRLSFYAAERGMGRLPQRHSSETPFEWYGRVIVKHNYFAPALGVLCDRFASTRFSPTGPSPQDRDEAVAALIELNDLARGLRLEDRVNEPADRPTDRPAEAAR